MLKVRASSLSGYVDCARRQAASMFREHITAAGYTLRQLPQNVGAAVGTAMHEGAAYSMKKKMEGGDLGSAAIAKDLAVNNLEIAMQEELLFDADTANRNDAIHQTISLVDVLRQHTLPTINPIMVEERLEATIGNIILSGQVDTCEHNGVMDWKSGRMKRHHINQVGAYGLLARTHGKGSEKGADVYAKRVKPGKEQPLPVTTYYDMEAAENSAVAVTRRIGKDFAEFQETGDRFAFIANPSSMLCGDKYCPAYATNFCREHKKQLGE